MAVETSKSLAAFFRREVGQSLRLVAHYTATSVEFVYLREDLDDEYDERTFRDSFDIHRQDRGAAATQESTIQAGDHHCTLRVYDEAIVFNFSQTDDVGTVVSVTPDVGRDLLTFVTRSLEELHQNSPQRVDAPAWV
jgi:hypothetical protein